MKKEAREGYKMTELGEIPNDWEVVKLKEIICEFVVPMRDKPKIFDGNIPWCRIEDIEGNYLHGNREGRLVSEKIIEEMNLKVLPKNSLIASCSATLGVYAINTIPLITNQTFIGLIPGEKVSVKYLLYYMNMASLRLKKNASGTTIPYISRESFEQFNIALPTIGEQEKIAEILSTVDEQIENTEKLIQKNQELKKGLMQQLLTKGIGHKEFKETEIGYIPNSWKLFKLGDIVKFEGGSQPPKKYFSNDYSDGMVRLIQIRDYKTDNFKIYAPKDLCRKFCDKNDVMIGRYGPPIFQILRGLDGAYNVALIKAIPDEEKMIKDYLFYFLKNEKLFNLIDSLSQRTSGQTGIDMDALKNYLVQLPTLLEQKRIVSILEAIDRKIENYKIKKESLEELKKGLMEKLLTGKIRVI